MKQFLLVIQKNYIKLLDQAIELVLVENDLRKK